MTEPAQVTSEAPATNQSAAELGMVMRSMALLIRSTFAALRDGCDCRACQVLRSNSHHLDPWLQRITDLGTPE